MITPTYVKRKYLSISTLLNFARCPRLYFYKKCGLEPDNEPVAATYGSAMHVAIPIAFQTWDRDRAMEGFMRVWDESWADEKRNLKCALRSIEHFIHTHKNGKSLYELIPPPDNIIQVDEKTSDYEVPWAIDIGLPIPLVGRMDSFCRRRDTGKKGIWELKTASRLNAQLMDQFDMNCQVLTYGLVGRTILDEPIEEAMVEVILVDPRKVDNQTQPVIMRDHQLEAQLRWLQWKGMQLLECEALAEKFIENEKEKRSGCHDPAMAFPQDFSFCTTYTHYYIPSYRCDFTELCRPKDWKTNVDIFKLKEDHDFVKLGIDSSAIKSTSKSF